jgi:small subunit ribosomal protein S6
MLRYETLILTKPEITQDEITALDAAVRQKIKEANGSFVSFERWGKFRLAYLVKNHEYGVYFLARFEAKEASGLKELVKGLETKLSLTENVMRFMTTELDPKASLVYKRPQSLEEAPAHDVDSFLKENKMDGLLGERRNGRHRSDEDDFDMDAADNDINA